MNYIEKRVDKDVNAAYYRFTNNNNKVAETLELDGPGLEDYEDYIAEVDENGEMVGRARGAELQRPR